MSTPRQRSEVTPDAETPWPSPIRRIARWAAVLLALAFAGRTLVSDWRLAANPASNLGPNGDISVYIGAINHLKRGGELYRWPLEGGYGFTYPPFAALVLHPMTWAAPRATGLVWLAATLALAVTVVALCVRQLGTTPESWKRVAAFALLVGLFLGSAQLQSEIITGQVNVALALLLVADIGFNRSRTRGALTGIAAAIKLTPLIAVGWLVLTKQWRAAATASSTFIGASLIGWIVLPAESLDYWTRAVRDTSRVGQLDLPMNASVMGTLAKLGLEGTWRSVLWLAIGAALVVLAYWRANQARLANHGVASAILLGAASVLASPISWPHHQIWLPLAACVMLLNPRTPVRGAGVGLALFCFLRIPIAQLGDRAGRLEKPLDMLDFVLFGLICCLGLGSRGGVAGGGSSRHGLVPRPTRRT